jgi:MFS family permease
VSTGTPLEDASLRADTRAALVRRRALAISVADGLMHAVMLGVTDNYLGALAVELGHGAKNQALLSTLPVLAGATSQLLAPTFIRLFGSRKRFVWSFAALQALTHLWFISIANSGDRALAPFLAAKILFFITGCMIAPPWSAWMASLTNGPGRERYFALRSSAIQAVLLAAFAFGAYGLHDTPVGGSVLERYTQLFWVGLGARTLSALFLRAQHDPERGKLIDKHLRLFETFERGDFRIVLYLALLHFGTYIASPFFVPYWLNELKLGYQHYALLVCTSVLAKAISLPTLHHAARRYGMDKVLYAAGLGAALLPLAWAATTSYGAFLFLQVWSGITWAAIEYASFQLLLKSTPDGQDDLRLEFLSIAGTMTGLGQVAGSLVGSALLDDLHLSYRAVFFISGAMRGAPLLLTFALARAARLRHQT